MDTSQLIVAGGGIAGLSAALALGQHDVLVLEKASAFTEVGAGLQLGPNAVRALQSLDAWDAVQPLCSSPPEIHMRDGITGKVLKRLPLGAEFEKRFGGPYHVAHRADLHGALLEVTRQRPQVELKTAEPLSAIIANTTGIVVETSAQRLSTQAVIAADGVNSMIRKSLFDNAAAVDSGSIFHRALLTPPLLSGIAMECVNLWLYPGGHVVHYPIGKTPRLNLIAIAPHDVSVNDFFNRACKPLRDLLRVASPHMSPWPGLYVKPLSTWVKSGVLLLGDAAHGTLPYLAQGAAMALEDAAALSQALKTAPSLRHAFAETTARRLARAMRLHMASMAAGRTYHHKGVMRLARNIVIEKMPPSFFQSRLDWIYKS